MPNLLRERIKGLSDYHDRLWRIIKDDGTVEALTDYNWEIMGWTDGLNEFCVYGGNAYYWLGKFQNKGWKVEVIDDNDY